MRDCTDKRPGIPDYLPLTGFVLSHQKCRDEQRLRHVNPPKIIHCVAVGEVLPRKLFRKLPKVSPFPNNLRIESLSCCLEYLTANYFVKHRKPSTFLYYAPIYN